MQQDHRSTIPVEITVDPPSANPAVLAEYQTLRQEILGYQRDSMNILAFAGVLATFSFGYAVHEKNGLLFFILHFILFAPVHLQVQRLRATYRIGRYIQTYLEGKETGLFYETRWLKIKSHTKRPWYDVLLSFKFAVTLPVMLLQGVTLFLAVHFFSGASVVLVMLMVFAVALLGLEMFLVIKADDTQYLLECLEDINQADSRATKGIE